MFTWKPIYAEIAKKLPSFSNQCDKLVALMIRLHDQGLKVSSVKDKDVVDVEIDLDEVDPFSFFANFNRNATADNRRAILLAIKEEWQLTSDLPLDFDGLPLMNALSSWFMPYKKSRDAEHVPKLWRFYSHCLGLQSAEQLDTVQFDACCKLSHVAPASLTMGMFWSRPDLWIAVDKKNLEFGKSIGVHRKVKTGADYLLWLNEVKAKTEFSTCEFSLQAHLLSLEEGEVVEEDESSTIQDRNYWLMAPGQGAVLWDNWYERGFCSIGWNDVGNLSEYESKAAMVDWIPKFYEDAGPVQVAHMLWGFSHDLKPGDIIFAKRGLHKVCGWGIVTGEYVYDERQAAHYHVRKIDWKDANEVTMPTGVQLPLKTLTNMTGKQTFLDEMAIHYSEIPGLQSPMEPPLPISPIAQSLTHPPYNMTEAMADLFMSDEEVETCVQLLKRKKNLVLQGAPGTGKTFIAKRLAYLLMGQKDDSRVQMVQFHQSTTYEDFVQGFKPSGQGGFKLENGSFHKFVDAALEKPSVPFVFIIDEINRGNLSKVFGELMMLIEHDKRSSDFAMPLSYSSDLEATFYVPPNVYLIGTMNTADRSLSMVDYALRRRFAFVELDPGFDSPAFAQYLLKRKADSEMISMIRARMKALNEIIAADETNLGKGYRIGHSYFVPCDEQNADCDWFTQILKFEIKPLLQEYYCDDPIQLAAALEILNGPG